MQGVKGEEGFVLKTGLVRMFLRSERKRAIRNSRVLS